MGVSGYAVRPPEARQKKLRGGEGSSNPQPHPKTMLLDLSRLVGPYAVLRLDHFELVPSRSNSFRSIRDFPGALLQHPPNQAGFLVGLNVLEPVQDLPHDLQIGGPSPTVRQRCRRATEHTQRSASIFSVRSSRACSDGTSGDYLSMGAAPGHGSSSQRTNLGAVCVQRNALSHHLDVSLVQTRSCAMVTGNRAGVAGFNARVVGLMRHDDFLKTGFDTAQ